MHLSRKIRTFPFAQVSRGSVVTIGAFDGVHLGHQRLLQRVLDEATARNLRAVVMSFDPTPKEYFCGENPPPRLTSFREKYAMLKQMGLEVFYCPPFNLSMQNISADSFVRTLLVHTMNVRHLVIGDDFRFARNREGNVALLQRAGRALNFGVEQVGSVTVEGERVSSTAIRDALGGGDLMRARRLLGSDYRMTGKVLSARRHVTQDRIVLVDMQRRRSPIVGVFAAKVRGISDNTLSAAACIGVDDSVGNGRSFLALQVYGVDQVPGGKYVQVDFIDRIDGPESCNSVSEGVVQMYEFEDDVRRVLARHDPT
jgi:riboflavin kinase/FMN adenylyltransferase